MDDTLLGIAIGAAATVLVGFGGALVSNLPAWTLEHRQSKKESRDELRRLLSEIVPLATDYVARVGVRSVTENTEPMLRLLALRSQLTFVIPAKDDVLRPFLEQSIALLIKQGPFVDEELRRAVAVAISEVLPGWFNSTMPTADIAELTESFALGLTLIKAGDAAANRAAEDSSAAAPEA
jgi:hypothetical protein